MSGISPSNFEFVEEALPLPAGWYLVTDPCYVIGEDPFWAKLCDWSFEEGKHEDRRSFSLRLGNHVAFLFGTAYGDGCYPVKQGGNEIGSCGVDAGMLSLIPMEYIEANRIEILDGTEIELKHSATPDYEDGNVTVGRFEIVTGDDEDETCENCGTTFGYINMNGLCESCQNREDEENEDEDEEDL